MRGAGSDIAFVQYGVKLPERWEPDDRRRELWHRARMLFAALPDGSHVFCEKPIAPRIRGKANPKTTISLSMTAGAVWTAHLHLDLYWYWVDNNTWKSEIVGSGSASKEQIQQFCNDRDVTFNEPDLYDAYCIYLYGTKMLT